MALLTPGLLPLPAVRCARDADAAAVAEVHDAAWRTAYADLIAAGLLDVQPFPRRVSLWRGQIGHGGPDRSQQLFVAERDGRVAGFAHLAGQRDAGLAAAGWSAEVRALYIHPRVQRRGLGRLLLSAVAHRLLDRGASRLTLWALGGNVPARHAYAALGGRVIAERPAPEGAPRALDRVAYGWDDLMVLV